MAKFELGQVVSTAGVFDKMMEDLTFMKFCQDSLFLYMEGNWGSTCEEDSKQNDYAVEHGERILAVYDQPGQPTIWIITEWDRSTTTILFPDEY